MADIPTIGQEITANEKEQSSKTIMGAIQLFNDRVLNKVKELITFSSDNDKKFTKNSSISVVPSNQLSSLNEFNPGQISIEQGNTISASELINQMNNLIVNLKTIRSITSEYRIKNGSGNVTTNETQDGYGLMQENLPSVPSGYSRTGDTNLTITILQDENSSIRQGKEITIYGLQKVMDSYFTQWRQQCDAKKLSYTYTEVKEPIIQCHSNCHSQCHGSRTRR